MTRHPRTDAGTAIAPNPPAGLTALGFPVAGGLAPAAAVARRVSGRDRSRRAVVLDFNPEALRRHRERMRAEGRDVASGLIFPNTQGGFVCKGNLLDRHYYPTLARAGLPEIRFHDLRHCCASLLLAAGVDTKVVGERPGHATPGFTAATYQHVLPGARAQAAGRLKAILVPQPESPK